MIPRFLTSSADSRLDFDAKKFSTPIVKLPLTVVSHPAGAGEDGSMPSSTPWARDEAAKKSGARKLEARIVKSNVQAQITRIFAVYGVL